MNVDHMGIVVAMIVLVGVLGVTAVGSGEFDIGVGEIKLPQINAGTNTDQDSFYNYCYKMGFDC
jgi:hypothetical protein